MPPRNIISATAIRGCSSVTTRRSYSPRARTSAKRSRFPASGQRSLLCICRVAAGSFIVRRARVARCVRNAYDFLIKSPRHPWKNGTRRRCLVSVRGSRGLSFVDIIYFSACSYYNSRYRVSQCRSFRLPTAETARRPITV